MENSKKIMTGLAKDIDRVYLGLQNLKIQPTKGNTAILFDALQVLENAYRFVEANAQAEEAQNAAEEEEGNG